MQVLNDEDKKLKSVKLHEHFFPIAASHCDKGYFLEPDSVVSDAFNILNDGSVQFTNPHPGIEASQYCVLNNVIFSQTHITWYIVNFQLFYRNRL